jgi:hypothetical protein
MKSVKVFFVAMTILLSALKPANALAQKGNPLKNIPVTDIYGIVSSAKISIDDFTVVEGTIYVTSTLTGFVAGSPISQTVSYPISILSSNCNELILSPGVLITGDNFMIANFSISINASTGSNRLTPILCSIAQLENSNASPHVLVARIKQAVRELVQ